MQLMLPPVLSARGQGAAPTRISRGTLALFLVLAATVPAWGLQSSGDFLARIKSIVGPAQGQAEVQVVRSQGGETLEGEAGLALFSGDQIRTGDGTQVVIFFLSDAEATKEITIDANSLMQVEGESSVFLSLGRLFAQLKGKLDVRLQRVMLGALGTEFQVEVSNQGRANLLVLDGTVGVTAERPSGRRLRGVTEEEQAASARESSRAQSPVAPQVVNIPSGGKTRISRKIGLTNHCLKSHVFEMGRSTSLSWVRLLGSLRIDLDSGQRTTVEMGIEIDATDVLHGRYVAEAMLLCKSCARERGCEDAWEQPFQVNIQVESKLLEGRVEADLNVGRLEEFSWSSESMPRESAAMDSRSVRSVLGWTSDVAVATRPSYAGATSIPWLSSPDEASSAFVEARFGAVWEGRPESFELLGDVYCDWGEGAWGLAAYESAKQLDKVRGEKSWFKARLGRAFRLTGQLEEAREILEQAVQQDPERTRGLNELGGTYLDQAKLERSRGNSEAARALLAKAAGAFARSSELSDRDQGGANQKSVLLANQGDVQLILGQMALQEGKASEAEGHLETALKTFRTAKSTKPDYAYAGVRLGQAYQALGELAERSRNPAVARRVFEHAHENYRQVIEAHPDMAPAYTALGSLYEQQGDKQQAIGNYKRALVARAQYAAPYARLGSLLKDEDSTLAAQYDKSYQILKKRTPRPKATDPQLGQVEVPNLMGTQLEKARSTLSRKQLQVGQVEIRTSSEMKGTVLFQQPRAGVRVKSRSRVDLVASGGSERVRVPKVEKMTREAAIRAIEEAGFAVGQVTEKESGKTPGTVVDQKPGGGKKVDLGSRIDLRVAIPKKEWVKVGKFIGKDQNKAIKEIVKKKLVVGQFRLQVSCETPGKVLGQIPEPNTKLLAGRSVDLVVADVGRTPVNVPRLKGLDLRSAQDHLRRAGLELGRVQEREQDQVPAGTVISQRPGDGTMLARGCPVELVISRAAALVTVPSLIGMTEEAARERYSGLKGIFAEFRLGSVNYVESRTRVGQIIRQDPSPGAQVRRGTPVNIVVARASERGPIQQEVVVVPNLIGMQLEQAAEVIPKTTRGRLRVGRVTEEHTRQSRPGTVIGQHPSPGIQVRSGSSIDLVVAAQQRSSLVQVPDVRGMSAGRAVETLKEVGLVPVVSNNGERVHRQSPSPGTQVKAGTRVTLVMRVN